MLNIEKTISLVGKSEINGQQVVYMSATLSLNGVGNETISKNVTNQDLYNANKESVRKDMRDFEDLVYDEQDKLIVK